MWRLQPLFNQLGHYYKYTTSLFLIFILHREWAGDTKSASIFLALGGALHGSPAKHNYITSYNKLASPDSRNLSDCSISHIRQVLKFLQKILVFSGIPTYTVRFCHHTMVDIPKSSGSIPWETLSRNFVIFLGYSAILSKNLKAAFQTKTYTVAQLAATYRKLR